jgi:FkbM family methyltransferase
MIEALIKKIFKILKAISSLSPRTLYHLVLKSSVKEIPQIQVIETKNGTFSGLSNDYLFKMAISQGTNEKHFVKLVEYLLGSSSVALDLGGNIGTHSITMSKLVKEGEVITFEPQSLTFSILQNNLLLNKCKNVTSYRFACSDENYKTISMQPFNFVTEPGDDYINNGALRVDLNSFVGDLTLTRTIDSFNFEKLDFIKIDIQGSEVKALRGARSTISKFKPYMFLEIEEIHLQAMRSSSKELIELVLSYQYVLYRIENNYPCDHICVPLEKVEDFEKNMATNLGFTISPKISGSKVELLFAHEKDQNYKSIKTFN